MKINSLEADIGHIYNILTTETEDYEIEKNCLELKMGETSRLN
jgi:hypothetical protein